MSKYNLPSEVKGEWIWSSSLEGKTSFPVFLRREFTIDPGSSSFDFWIAATSSFQIFINGSYAGYGHSHASDEIYYAFQYDVSCYLQSGLNVIGILVKNSSKESFRSGKGEGIWCQLNENNAPFIWSDSRWRLSAGICYENRGCTQHASGVSPETVNMQHYPYGWAEDGFNDSAWEAADLHRSYKEIKGELLPFPSEALCSQESALVHPVYKGIYEESIENSRSSFSGIYQGGEGVYTAVSYVFCEEESSEDFSVICFSDIKVFCNDIEMDIEEDLSVFPPESPLEKLKEKAVCFPSGNMRLVKGWNKIRVIQRCYSGAQTFWLLFPGRKKSSLKFCRTPDKDAITGWTINGPLKMPFDFATASLRTPPGSECSSFTPLKENVTDVSAYLAACTFKPVPETYGENIVAHPINDEEYIILELDKMKFGLLNLECSGSEGDILDINISETMIDGNLPPFKGKQRNCSSIVLKNGINCWTKMEPVKVKHIMLAARKSSSGIKIDKLSVTELHAEHESSALFDCDDQFFKQLWKAGCASGELSEATLFSGDTGAERPETIADFFFQSMLDIYAYGDYRFSRKSLLEFGNAAYENGFIPSSLGRRFPCKLELSLLWPLWFESHCRMAKDEELVDLLLPVLDRFLEFLSSLGQKYGNILYDIPLVYSCDSVSCMSVQSRNGMNTILNAMYCRTLLSSATIYDIAEMPERADGCRALAKDISKKIRELVFSPETGLFADNWTDGDAPRSYSLKSNIIALFSGVAKQSQFSAIYERFFDIRTGMPLKADECIAPCTAYYLLEILFAFGKSKEAFSFIRKHWGKILDEYKGLSVPENSGMSERCCPLRYEGAAAALPVIFIMREMAGIRPAAPGFLQIYFNPAFETVNSVKSLLPTPYGKISIEWTKKSASDILVRADANYPLDIVLMIPEKVQDKCTFELGQSVGILEDADVVAEDLSEKE